jgi:photosystem II stability/assembly factor-like uncharacterized protein
MRYLVMGLFLLAVPQEVSWWAVKSTGVDSILRGVAVAVIHGKTTIWVTGTKGTLLRSTDGGENWQKCVIPDEEPRDFRGVQTFDGSTAYVMASGAGEKSGIYKTADGGHTWEQQYKDTRTSFFLDAIACSDETHCVALSDPVDGKFLLLRTEDGKNWEELPREHMPNALPKEGAFAASNSGLLVFENHELYFGTGGQKARVFHSTDMAQTWTVSETPILSGKASEGIFSIVRAGDTVVAVGGDYAAPTHREKTAAYSTDQGKTWKLSSRLPGGFRSAVETFDAGFLTVGPNGAETSRDGEKWEPIGGPNLNALNFSYGKGWAVGAAGVVAKFVDQTQYGK